MDNGIQEKNLYFYHPDHLGSSSYITDREGRITQHTEYIAFGEVLFEEHSTSKTMPYLFNGKELDSETGLYYYGARYYDAKTSIFLNVDPLAEKYPHVSPYTYSLNNPINLIDPNGQEPILPYVGTVKDFTNLLNNSPSRVGKYTRQNAHVYMMKLGNTEWSWSQMRPLPTQTGFFNMKKGRYIYTEKGGWIDMTHFLFYAGKAYKYKEQGYKNPIGEAVQDGYAQESSDEFVAHHSAYSYEDLPSDKFGAEFAVNHFDPNSELTFSEQLEKYLVNQLGATNPQEAPNYKDLPKADNQKTPSIKNRTTTPIYTKENTNNIKKNETNK